MPWLFFSDRTEYTSYVAFEKTYTPPLNTEPFVSSGENSRVFFAVSQYISRRKISQCQFPPNIVAALALRHSYTHCNVQSVQQIHLQS